VGVFVGKGILELKDGGSFLMLANFTSKEVNLPGGTVVGELTKFVENDWEVHEPQFKINRRHWGKRRSLRAKRRGGKRSVRFLNLGCVMKEPERNGKTQLGRISKPQCVINGRGKLVAIIESTSAKERHLEIKKNRYDQKNSSVEEIIPDEPRGKVEFRG
jgi:hypothetical protein